MPTIKDIAKAAGVSHGTVSNVLNKRGNVSYEKIRLVEETARSMGYALDEKASLLRKGSTKTIAVILPSISEPQYADLYNGILTYAETKEYSIRLFLTEDFPELECKAITEALAIKACAILSVSCLTSKKKDYQPILSSRIPLLFLERDPQNASLPHYSFDMEQIAGKISQIIQEGSVCCILKDSRYSDQALFASRLHEIRDDMAFYENIHNGQSPAIYKLLAEHPDCNWMIAASETLADQIYHVFTTGSRTMPHIISLSSLRPTQNGNYFHVTLNYRSMGYEASKAVIDKLEQQRPVTTRIFHPSSFIEPVGTARPVVKKPLRMIAHRTPAITSLKYLVPQFERKYGIPVEIITYPLSTIYGHILSDDEEPWDVVRLDPSGLSFLAPKIFIDLAAIDTAAPTLFKQYLSGLTDDFSVFGGKLYSLPFDISVQMLFYHRGLLESSREKRAYYELTGKTLEIPQTYEDYNQICRFFTKSYREESPVKYGTSVSLGNPTSAASEYLPRLLAAGGLSYSVNGCLDLGTPEALLALKGYLEQASCSSSTPVHSWNAVADHFARGLQATTILFVNHASRIMTGTEKHVSQKIGFSPVPGGKPLLAGGALGVGIHSRQPEEAYQFIKWATGETIAAELVMLGGLSACKCAYEQRAVLDTYPWLTELQENINLGMRRPILSLVDVNYNQRDFEFQLGKQLIEAIKGNKSPEQALSDTQKILDSIS